MAQHMHRVAHRGGSLLAPENTLSAFRNALTLSIDAIELDVQMSKDGQNVVFHDNTVERLTDGSGNILDLDFAYLRSLNAAAHFAGGWPQAEQIPTLHEVLDLVKGRLRIYLEIKTSFRAGVYGQYPKIAETVVKEIQAAKMVDRVFVISFDWAMLTHIKSLEPSLQVGANVSRTLWNPQAEQALEKLYDQVAFRGCNWINLDHRLFTPDIPEFLHRRGLKLNLWTVNTLEDLQRLIAAGVDSLTTDRPDFFSQL